MEGGPCGRWSEHLKQTFRSIWHCQSSTQKIEVKALQKGLLDETGSGG